MPSIIVKRPAPAIGLTPLQEGMVYFGEVFDRHYAKSKLTPLTVLFMTFNEIANNNAYSVFFEATEDDGAGGTTKVEKELKFRGLNKKATGILFRVEAPNVTKRVILRPVEDDYDPDADATYQMNVSFPHDRKSEIGGTGYLARNIDDIVTVGGGDPATLTTQDAARKYMFASISYRRCI